jgi:catechol 2,3-dioxygenase-like lactoylglutathione lyase family enzyme
VAVVVADLTRATRFYTDAIGLVRHGTKPNWLLCPGGGAVHLIEWSGHEPDPDRHPQAHLALAVACLEAARDRLFAAGLVPWQNGLDWSHRDVADGSASLDWGIGTLFVRDPDGNAIELVEPGRGIFAAHARD